MTRNLAKDKMITNHRITTFHRYIDGGNAKPLWIGKEKIVLIPLRMNVFLAMMEEVQCN